MEQTLPSRSAAAPPSAAATASAAMAKTAGTPRKRASPKGQRGLEEGEAVFQVVLVFPARTDHGDMTASLDPRGRVPAQQDALNER